MHKIGSPWGIAQSTQSAQRTLIHFPSGRGTASFDQKGESGGMGILILIINQNLKLLKINFFENHGKKFYRDDLKSNFPTFQGLVACEICSGDELVLTEILFNYNSPFHQMGPSEIAAILSCFVFDETAYSSTKDLTPTLRNHFEAVQVCIFIIERQN